MFARTITNFGANIRFAPRHVYTPHTEAEVLAILRRHARGQVRVLGSLHSWSPAFVASDAVVDLRHFDSVSVVRNNHGDPVVRVGGGCRVKHLLHKLHAISRYTLPSIGLITQQTIAGAISTGTHGSGRHSLSHYVEEVRLAAFTGPNGDAAIITVSDGDALRAARCSLGCLGIILSVTLRCVPRYDVIESIAACDTLPEVLASERSHPLQQFYLLPFRWTYLVQRRQVAPSGCQPRTPFAILYRVWWLIGIDVGLHLIIKTLASLKHQSRWTRLFYRSALSHLIIKNWFVRDRAERMLVMKHDLFRHVEIELFVPARHLSEAIRLIRFVLEWFDGSNPTEQAEIAKSLHGIGMWDRLRAQRGRFTHHYPITFRRVLPDDTLLSMASDEVEPYYAISFISLAEPRAEFLALADFLAHSLMRLCSARVHWGKLCPLTTAEVESLYPHLGLFRELCQQFDPQRTFQNEFTGRIIPPPCNSERTLP